jgi:uncharacterized membrane protein YphA (DoxX/SURF4 family)
VLGPLLPILWVGGAVAVLRAAARSRREPSALDTGRRAVGFLFLVAGAAVNTVLLLRGDDYAEFADGSYLAYVRDTWRSLVVPHHDVFISALVVFELVVGSLALVGGRRTQLAYGLAIAFHVALLSFGWGFFLWSLPMLAALGTLLRSERDVAAARAPVPVPAPG